MSDQDKNVLDGDKKDQLANFVEKIWGHEEWIVNNAKYCGKKLVVKKGYSCSLHYHKKKHETFYAYSGKVLLEIKDGNESTFRVMTKGDISEIKIGCVHRFTGIKDSEIFEFSTFHSDDDSHRLESSGFVGDKKL